MARRGAARVAPPRQRPLLFNFDPTLSTVERGRRQTQWVVLLTIVTLALVLLLGGVGFYINAIRQPSAPVAVVNGEPIRRDTWQHYQALLTAELQGQAFQLQSNQPAPNDAAATAKQRAALNAIQQQLSGVGDQAVNDLISAQIVNGAVPAIVKAGAPAAQIVPTNKQIDAALAQEKTTLGVATASQYQQVLSSTGYNEAQLRAILTTRLEEDNIKTYLSKGLQPVQPQVKARIMTFGDAAKAAAALKDLQSGQHWADVDAKYQKDTAAKETSRSVDWTPKGQEDATFDTFAFAAKPFQISGVLSDSGSSEIIQVEDVAPARPLSQTQIDQIQSKTYADWLTKQTNSAQVQRYPQNMGP
ncbi:MAG TPA: SurA N-terminal domain-containing protein [Chloroflexota bacterium]|jgi:parvulin-like peptidyl-prolyl isomerase|nr:SurA N-terminal domain-containing protein [Chloroflexota bacterium]